ncbi:hypothetical protein JMUB6875_43170 [Nocardia sp. JMUB6875]
MHAVGYLHWYFHTAVMDSSLSSGQVNDKDAFRTFSAIARPDVADARTSPEPVRTGPGLVVVMVEAELSPCHRRYLEGVVET